MPINKMKLFEDTKALWPDVIDSNGMTINGERVEGLRILNELYDMYEESFDVNDHWNQLAIWSFHQALWVHSQRQLKNERPLIYPKAVAFEDFDQMMRENLMGDCWTKERKIYFEDTKMREYPGSEEE